jgi:hypothetical protein
MKGRSGATDHALYDSVRGVQKDIVTNTPAPAETTEPTGLTAFNSDGFSGGALAKINTLGATYVDWMWKKGVVPGVDVVIYTGNAASPRTISHALGVAPRMVIVKRRDAASVSGRVLHLSASATAGASLYLDATNLVTADNGDWNTTVPTASVFTINTNLNVNAALYAAWLFAEVPGFSRFGGFVGAGNADGVFVWCGFRPRWILAKRYDAGDHWYLYDTARSAFNVVTADLNPNGANAEPFQSFPLDILSNGFKWRGTTGPNGGGSIFAAFAERPFKFARAR